MDEIILAISDISKILENIVPRIIAIEDKFVSLEKRINEINSEITEISSVEMTSHRPGGLDEYLWRVLKQKI